MSDHRLRMRPRKSTREIEDLSLSNDLNTLWPYAWFPAISLILVVKAQKYNFWTTFFAAPFKDRRIQLRSKRAPTASRWSREGCHRIRTSCRLLPGVHVPTGSTTCSVGKRTTSPSFWQQFDWAAVPADILVLIVNCDLCDTLEKRLRPHSEIVIKWNKSNYDGTFTTTLVTSFEQWDLNFVQSPLNLF